MTFWFSSEEDESNESKSSEEVVSAVDTGDLGLADDTANPLLRLRRSTLDLGNLFVTVTITH